MKNLRILDNEIQYTREGERIRITSCHKDSIRFEAFPGGVVFEQDFTLMPRKCTAEITEKEHEVIFTAGELSLKLEENGKATYYRGGRIIIEEQPEMAFNTQYRFHLSVGSGLWSSRVTFKSADGERFYGMGHEPTGCFDLKGCTFDLRHVNTKCSIPYVYSSLGYGFIWNNPATGTVELANNRTRWNADATKKVDYVVTAGTPAQASEALADLTGHAPAMPHWATGFWQSRLRYETQEDLLEVARRYKKEGIPLSVIICDYFHWTQQGDYKFEPEYWTDVKAMTKELHDMGVRLVVSMWPTVDESSENYQYMKENNLLIHTARGYDKVFNFHGLQAEIDVTNPETREYVFGKLKENYLDNGVDGLWFDEAEPEIHPEQFDNLIFSIGRGDEVALIYPYYYSMMAYEGLRSTGQEVPVTLTRCAYLGSQKFGALVWSGDVPSTFESLSQQVKAGLNMSMCGIPWWNTDIGGFWGGDTTSDEFRELIVRWFQYGVFCPVMRVHGVRNLHGEKKRDVYEPSGDPNELWSFGERNFVILRELVMLRERLRPYIEEQMRIASETGHPVMRPMFFDYPDDEICYTLGEQYMFGSDIIFAPIVTRGQIRKSVYIPKSGWVRAGTDDEYAPGWHEVEAGISEFIAFVRKGSDTAKCFC